MAPVTPAISEHDVVVLREAVGDWPADAVGTVISVYHDGVVLVEITEPDGKTLDCVQVSPGQSDVKRR